MDPKKQPRMDANVKPNREWTRIDAKVKPEPQMNADVRRLFTEDHKGHKGKPLVTSHFLSSLFA
jgi:hypothetical protein